MAESVSVKLRVRVSWWVRPYLWIVIVNSHLGIPVDLASVEKTVARGVHAAVDVQ